MIEMVSSLQAVNPVSMGKTRSKQQMALEGAFSSNINEQFSETVLNIQVLDKLTGIHVLVQRFEMFIS